ncbi:MAG: 16S rRNA (uracil(1498)-N(3))-methyltransferase [Pseudomonadota bacterium]
MSAPSPRLHLDADLSVAETPLSREQAHYLGAVLRRGAGDAVRVFNGRDGERAAEIVEISKKGGTLRLLDETRAARPEPGPRLAFAPVKRGPTDFLIQKATELGAAAFAPVLTERTIAARVKDERLEAIAVGAAEQCERLTVPAFEAPAKLPAFLDAFPKDKKLLFADEAGDDPDAPWGGPAGRARPIGEALRESRGAPEDWTLLIGPEGGFAPAERDRLRSFPFVVPVSLGPRILRADTAALAALAVFQTILGDLR